MGKKKRNGISRQTIPREQKLDPDSSDEDSGDQAAGAFKIEPDTVLKLDDDDHSTVSGGASDDTYTYSQRELPVAIAKHIADIHDDERIERVTERMQRMETVSGWNRGRALKEVGVEIPKDDKLYAKEFTPTKDPWATSDDPVSAVSICQLSFTDSGRIPKTNLGRSLFRSQRCRVRRVGTRLAAELQILLGRERAVCRRCEVQLLK